MNQKGQAFSVFKLLISAVIAVVILTLLLSIIAMLGIFEIGDPAEQAGTLVRNLSTSASSATYKTSQDVFFEKDKGINTRAIAKASGGNIGYEQVCVSAGDFSGEAFWDEGDAPYGIYYRGTERRRAKIGAICDNGSVIDAEGVNSYFEKFAGGAIDFSEMFSNGCDCISADEDRLCCLVVVKKPT